MTRLKKNLMERKLCKVLSDVHRQLDYTTKRTEYEVAMGICKRGGKLFPSFVTIGTEDYVKPIKCPKKETYALYHTHWPSPLRSALGVATPSALDLIYAEYHKIGTLCIGSPTEGKTRCYKMRQTNKETSHQIDTYSHDEGVVDYYVKMGDKYIGDLVSLTLKQLDKIVEGYFTCPYQDSQQ